MEILNIKNLSFTYPDSTVKALNNISLSVSPGDFILICGNSGSGKSTLLRLLKEELSPHGVMTGEIGIKKDAVIGIVAQDAENQIVSDTVWHNLAFGLENMRMERSKIKLKIAEISEFFNLTDIFEQKTYSLSGGEKQLLNLASVMIMEPDILLLDEPTSQLDPVAAQKFTDILKRLNSEFGLTVIIAEHRTEELFNFADKIILMDEGNIVLSGDPEKTASDIRKLQRNDILLNLPTAVRIYAELNIKTACPKTVKECKAFLSNHFDNKISMLENNTEEKHDKALELKNIYFRYDKNSDDILKGLSMSVNFNEITTVIGGNGSGKSTLLSIIASLHKPYAGKLKYYCKKTAVLPQNVKSVFTKDVLREDFLSVNTNYSSVAESLSVTELLERNPYDLSGGEMQRAALAKMLLLEPQILCLDEPTKGIDGKGKSIIIKILRELAKAGLCIIIVTHDTDFAAEISDRCMMLFNGEIVSSEIPRKFFSDNKFYTTYASRASEHIFKNAVTCADIVELCKRNGEKRQ